MNTGKINPSRYFYVHYFFKIYFIMDSKFVDSVIAHVN